MSKDKLNMGRFKKGQVPWNKGTKGTYKLKHSGQFKKGFTPWNKGKKFPQFSRKNSATWKGGKYLTPWGYAYTLKPRHPNSTNKGYIFEHRIVVENKIGRYLKFGEVVHHLGEKDDNRYRVLMAFVNNSAHKRFHKNPNNVKPEEIIFDGRKL